MTKKYNKYNVTIEDTGDGSGDGLLTFPPEMIEELGWYEGLELKFDVEEDGVIIISPKNLQDVVKKQQGD